MYEKQGIKYLEPGDKIKVGTVTATINHITHQEYYPTDDNGDPDCWIVEFYDETGGFRSYKSQWDKGEIIPVKRTTHIRTVIARPNLKADYLTLTDPEKQIAEYIEEPVYLNDVLFDNAVIICSKSNITINGRDECFNANRDLFCRKICDILFFKPIIIIGKNLETNMLRSLSREQENHYMQMLREPEKIVFYNNGAPDTNLFVEKQNNDNTIPVHLYPAGGEERFNYSRTAVFDKNNIKYC